MSPIMMMMTMPLRQANIIDQSLEYTRENLIKFFRGVIDIVIKVTNFIQNILCTQQH